MELRPAIWRDRAMLYRWRQRDEEEAPWYHGSPVSYQDHNRWFARRMESPIVQLWIATHQGGPVGQVRLDSNGEISYSLIPEMRGQGLAPEMLRLAVKYAPHNRVKANVDQENEPGARSLLAAGFEYRPDVEFYLWRK